MTNILHRIKAYLYRNVFTEDSNEYLARVRTERSLDVKTICHSAVTRGGVNITAPAMQYAVEQFLKEMEYQLCNGYSVNTGSFTATPSVKGVFHSPNEDFDPQKHTLSFRFNQGESLRRRLPAVEVEIVGVADTGIYIERVIDPESGSVNKWITPCYSIRINGKKLKLAGDHPEVGVYFINQETGARIKVEEKGIITNYPSELIISVPPLETGNYELQVTTQYIKNHILKKPQTTIFEHVLHVK